MKSGPIIIIEDDEDDESVLSEVLKELGLQNKLIWFDRCHKAFNYFCTTKDQPFLIFCDVNLPGQKGIDFKRQVDETPELRKKSIPFIFYSTSADQGAVTEAYTDMTVQGFFKKPDDFKNIKATIQLIIDYWLLAVHPNSFTEKQ